MFVLAKLFHIEGDVSDIARLFTFALACLFIHLFVSRINQKVSRMYSNIFGESWPLDKNIIA